MHKLAAPRMDETECESVRMFEVWLCVSATVDVHALGKPKIRRE